MKFFPQRLLTVILLILSLSEFAACYAQEEGEQTEFLPFREASARVEEIREKLREWDQAVLGFRKEHQFALIVGSSSGEWHFKRFGNLRNKSYESSGIFSKFQYSFHIPMYRGLGYFLGSSAGYMYERDVEEDIEPASSIMLPGLLAGLALNITPGMRIAVGLDYYLERWSNLGERNDDTEEENPTVSITARSLDALATVDIFYKLKWAVRFEAHRHNANAKQPKDAAGKPVDAVVSKVDHWLGVGLLYHLF